MKKGRKRKVWALIIALCLLSLTGCGETAERSSGEIPKELQFPNEPVEIMTELEADLDLKENAECGILLIDSEGMTLQTRILTPEGYSRVPAEAGSLTQFLREYPLKEDGSPVLLYDGREKGNQSVHQAVLALPIEAVDLQQCADSVMRIYAEYYYQTGQPEKLAFHFTNGFLAEYVRWRDGERIKVDGNQV